MLVVQSQNFRLAKGRESKDFRDEIPAIEGGRTFDKWSSSLLARTIPRQCPDCKGDVDTATKKKSDTIYIFHVVTWDTRTSTSQKDKSVTVPLSSAWQATGNITSQEAACSPNSCVELSLSGTLQRSTSSYLLRDSLSVVADKLEPYGLIRIHRSVLVNAAFVEGIRLYSTGEYGLQIKGGKEYTVTRTYKKNLKFLAKFWIGTGGLFSG